MTTGKALAVKCADRRLHKDTTELLDGLFGEGNWYEVSVAGATLELDFILSQLRLLKDVGHISFVCLIPHRDCAAYRSKYGTNAEVNDKHMREDLDAAVAAIRREFPDLAIYALVWNTDHSFEEVTKLVVPNS